MGVGSGNFDGRIDKGLWLLIGCEGDWRGRLPRLSLWGYVAGDDSTAIFVS